MTDATRLVTQDELLELLGTSEPILESRQFRRISKSLLLDNQPVVCDIYTLSPTGAEVLIARHGQTLRPNSADDSAGWSQRELYIADTDFSVYFAARAAVVYDTLASTTLSDEFKTNVIYYGCQDAITLLQNAESREEFWQAQQLLSSATAFFLSRKQAQSVMRQLAEYSTEMAVHSTNVGFFALMLVDGYFGRSLESVNSDIFSAFFLHDVGHSISETALSANQHAETGAKFLRDSKIFSSLACHIVEQHHAPWSQMIHPYAAACRLADQYDRFSREAYFAGSTTPTYDALKKLSTEMTASRDTEMLREFIRLFSNEAI